MSSSATFFNRVRDQRLTHGWTQAELAARAGVPRASLSAIEIGRLVPSVAAALKLAACLGSTVEDLFGHSRAVDQPEWAWPPAAAESRYWRAEVAGSLLSFPAEETAAGEVAHDGILKAGVDRYVPCCPPDQTLVVACCDPAAGLLASEYARQTSLRMIVLGRSSKAALALLAQGRIHVAGLHLSEAGQRGGNAGVASREVGRPVGLLRLARWQEGVAIGAGNGAGSLRTALRGRLNWVGREPGSGARQCFDELPVRRQPSQIALDHRGVAIAVRCGWADAGVCLRLVSEEAGLRFFPVRVEDFDLAFLKSMEGDPRIRALIRVVRSAAYRRLMAGLPGYDLADAGSLEWAAGRRRPSAQ